MLCVFSYVLPVVALSVALAQENRVDTPLGPVEVCREVPRNFCNLIPTTLARVGHRYRSRACFSWPALRQATGRGATMAAAAVCSSLGPNCASGKDRPAGLPAELHAAAPYVPGQHGRELSLPQRLHAPLGQLFRACASDALHSWRQLLHGDGRRAAVLAGVRLAVYRQHVPRHREGGRVAGAVADGWSATHARDARLSPSTTASGSSASSTTAMASRATMASWTRRRRCAGCRWVAPAVER